MARYNSIVDEPGNSATGDAEILIPDKIYHQIVRKVCPDLSFESDVPPYLDQHLREFLQLVCSRKPTRLADLDEWIDQVFKTPLHRNSWKDYMSHNENKKKDTFSFLSTSLPQTVRKRFLSHLGLSKADQLITHRIILLLEFWTTKCLETIRNFIHNAKKNDGKSRTISLSDANIAIIGLSAALSDEHFSGSTAHLTHRFDDLVRNFVKNQLEFTQGLRFIQRIFKPVFTRIQATGSALRPLMFLEEIRGIFDGLDDLLEASETFDEMLEELPDILGQEKGIVTAFEELDESNDALAFLEYSRRILRDLGADDNNRELSPAEAIARVLGRPEAARIVGKELSPTFGSSSVDIVRYVMPVYLLSPVFWCSGLVDALEKMRVSTGIDEHHRELLEQSEKNLRLNVQQFIERQMEELPLPRKRRMETLSLHFDAFADKLKLSDLVATLEESDDLPKEWRHSRSQLILESTFQKLNQGKKPPSERKAFLFENGLILCKALTQTSKTPSGHQYRLKERFIFHQRFDINCRDVQADAGCSVFELLSSDPSQHVTLKASGLDEKELWLGWLLLLQHRQGLKKLLDAAEAAEEAAHPLHLPIPEIYKFSIPDSPDNIIYSEEPADKPPEQRMPKAGNQTKLIEKLTSHEAHDYILVYTKIFLITFRCFMQLDQEVMIKVPETELELQAGGDSEVPKVPTVRVEKKIVKSATWNLLDNLKERYYIPGETDGNIDVARDRALNITRKRFNKKYRIPIQKRVLVVIKQWVEHHFSDFESDSQLLSQLLAFLDTEMRDRTKSRVMKQRLSTIRKIIDRKVAHAEIHREPQFPSPKPEFKIHLELSVDSSPVHNWMIYHPAEIARQITLLESEYYRSIKASELLEYKAGSDERNARVAPNIRKNIRFTTTLTNSLCRFIVETEDLQERIAVLSRIIEIMHELYKLNNFVGVIADFNSCLQNNSIYRLEHTKRPLSSRLSDWLKEMDIICSKDSNFKEYFRRLRSVDPPCIPFLGFYLTRLDHNNENREFIENASKTAKLINFSRYQKAGSVVLEVQQYQNQPYCFQVNREIRNWLEELDPYEGLSTEDFSKWLYEQSLKIEPRDCEESKLPKFSKRFNFSLKSPMSRPPNLGKSASGTSALGHGPSSYSLNSLTSPLLGRGYDDKCRTPSSSDGTPAQSPLYPVPERMDGQSFDGEEDDVTLTSQNADPCDPPPPPVPPRLPRINRAFLDLSPGSQDDLRSLGASSSFSFSREHIGMPLLTPPLPARPSSNMSSTPNCSSSSESQFDFENVDIPEINQNVQVDDEPPASPPPPLPPKTLPRHRSVAGGMYDDTPPVLPPRKVRSDTAL